MATLTDIAIEDLETLVSSERQTALVERSARAGTMSPLHRRDEEETYRVLEGEVTFHIGAETVHARRDDLVVAPAGVARTFRVGHEDSRWLVLTRVDSVERYVDFGRATARPMPASMAGWPSAEELSSLAAIASANGIDLLGPPGDLPDAR